MNEEPMSKEQQEGQEPEVEQAGAVSDDVLGAVSGGGNFNADGSMSDSNNLNIQMN